MNQSNPKSVQLVTTGQIEKGYQTFTAIDENGNITTKTIITTTHLYIYVFDAMGKIATCTRFNLATGGKIRGDLTKIKGPIEVERSCIK
jgi:hypothetical protein